MSAGELIKKVGASVTQPPADDDDDTDYQDDTDYEAYVPTPPTTLFDDVNSTHWFYGYVNTVAYKGLFQGTAYRIFSPNMPMTRAMFVQVIANMENADLSAFAQGNPVFNDVRQGTWYFAAVQWAYAEGITIGIGEGNFAPNAPITREQMALMLYRYTQHRDIELSEGTMTPFTDHNTISYWSIDAVEVMQAAGIITGRPDGSFAPRATATRAEVAAVFVRLVGSV